MTISIYRSTDSSAPTLTGQVGSLTTLLDAILVNGYGAKSSLGWTIDQTGSSLRTYRQPVGSNRYYLAVDDTNAQNSRVRMFESVTTSGVAATAGVNPGPNEATVAGGLYAYKSSVADATARPWLCISNGKIFYLLWQYSGSTTTSQGLYFGDFTSYRYADAFNTILVSNNAASATGGSIKAGSLSPNITSTDTGWIVDRNYAGILNSIAIARSTDGYRGFGATEVGASGATYPLPMDGSLQMAPVWLADPGAVGVRGHLPGFWSPLHARPLAHGNTVSGTGNLSGKTFEAYNLGNAGQVLLETSDTWS